MNVQINIDWWKAEDRSSSIDEGHKAALMETGIERACQMIADGYSSGELSDWVRMHDTDPEDGIPYRGWWELKEVEEAVDLPEGWLIMPEDLVTHLNDWRGACEIAIAHIEADDAMEHQDLRDSWQNKIYLLNNAEWKLGNAGIDKGAFDLPQGWDLAPAELESNLHVWKQACEVAVAKSAPRHPETWADDKGYWEKQLHVIKRIEDLLNTAQSSKSPWTSVSSALPSIPANHIRGEKPFIVKLADGSVHVAHLFAGHPNAERNTWRVDEDGKRERHWVALEGGGPDTDRILSDVIEWMFLPGTEGDLTNFVEHASLPE